MGKNIRNVFLKGLNLLILIVFALICFYPLYFVFINSFSSASAITKGVYLLPQKPTLIYYRYLLLTPSIGHHHYGNVLLVYGVHGIQKGSPVP